MANRFLALELRRRTGQKLRDIGPMRAARRDALLALGIQDRRFGWPLEMVLRAAAAGWRIDEIAVPYAPRTGQSKVTGTVSGTMRAVRDMSRVLADIVNLLVMAKAPVAGRVKTRLCPPCTPAEAAAIAEAALADTLDAVAACGAGRRIVALDGEPGPGCRPASR